MLKKLLLESVFATGIVFGVMWLLVSLPLNLSALQPLENAIEEFDILDLYYSQLQANEGRFSKNVVVVNIGDADRAEIAQLIDFVSIGSPKAIGVDVFFAAERNAKSDTFLHQAIVGAGNVVMASYLNNEKLAHVESSPYFRSNHTGFTNFIGVDAQHSTIRHFKPIISNKTSQIQSFSVAVASMANPHYASDFIERAHVEEAIRFTGNTDAFLVFDKNEILSFEIEPELFADKVVLLGFLGNTLSDAYNFEDKLFTPLNDVVSGRSVPDMYGVLVHANIVEMILSRNWITQMPAWLKNFANVLLVYLHVIFYMYLIIKWDLYFDAWSKVLQVGSSLLLLFLVFLFYQKFNYRLHITPGLIGIALAVDTLFVYEAIANSVYRRFNIKSVLIED